MSKLDGYFSNGYWTFNIQHEIHVCMLVKTILFFSGTLLCLSCSQKQERKSLAYGSNNGKYLAINGTRMYYEEYGKGPTLLLLHGGMGSISDFEKCIPKLSE